MKRFGTAARIDFMSIAIEVADAEAPPQPGRSTARRTAEGYLECDAFIARDGLLRYSDGVEAWNEYRPRSELQLAAKSWANAPITDDHPPSMVNAQTHSAVARGVVIDTPTVVEVDGVGYVRARLSIRDAALIAKIIDGQRELSIGFLADVKPAAGTFDGQRYDAVQVNLVGNHVASVAKGRAGPAVRVMLDGAQIPVYHFRASPLRPPEPHIMTKIPADFTPARLDALIRAVAAKVKADEVGMPVTMSKIVLSTGEEVEIPTELAAIIEEWKASKKAAASEAQPAAPAAGTEAAGSPPPAAAPAGGEPPKTEEEKEAMKPDAVNALVAKTRADTENAMRKRAGLERLAERHAVKCDGADGKPRDDEAIGREIVIKVCPHLKAQAEAAKGDALDVLVEVARATPPAPTNPFARPVRVDGADSKASLEVERIAKAWQSQGY